MTINSNPFFDNGTSGHTTGVG